MSNKTERKWQILPKASEEFLKNFPEFDRLSLQLIFNRGLKEKKDIEVFFADDGGESFAPFLFKDMEAAVDLLIKHVKDGSKIAIYGDYDADGATATAVLMETLAVLKADVDAYIPDRVKEGYGMNKEAIDILKKEDTKLIITVDNGIRAGQEIAYARGLGMDVIVTDHHVLPENKKELPDCLIINPARTDDNYPFRFLAGVGVAYKLALAVISRAKISEDMKKALGERILDLVAIGTVADCVPLFGENRVLVKRGLEILNRGLRPGLSALTRAANITSAKLDSWNISFQLAPRLNAAGRLDHANTALALLLTKDQEEAVALAAHLNSVNQDRQKSTEEIFNFVEEEIEKEGVGSLVAAVAPADSSWSEGVVGLVAGKIAEKYYRPAIIIARGEDSFKGSGRSIEEFNIVKALEKCAEYLEKYGGHPAACGFTVKDGCLEKFLEKMKALAAVELETAELKPRILIEAEAGSALLNLETARALNKFAPFGEGNARPKLATFGLEVLDVMNMGLDGQHIKLRLKVGAGLANAIGFGQAEEWKNIKIGDIIDIAYYLETNEFNGREEAQMKIVDIKMTNYKLRITNKVNETEIRDWRLEIGD